MNMAAPEWVQLQSSVTPVSKEDSSSKRIKDLKRRQREAIKTAYQKGFLRQLDYDYLYEHTFGRKVPTQDELQQLQQDGEESPPELDLGELPWLNLVGAHVRSLDEFTILSCTQLKICNLSSNYVSDISAFYACISLVKLDLRNNQIDKLPSRQFWASLKELRILYLHGNSIGNKDCIRKLNGCPTLHLLTMYDTPISLMKNYRHHVVNSVWSLKALDHFVVSDEEIIEDIYLRGAFAALSTSFKIQSYIPCPKHSTYQEEHKRVYELLLTIDRILAKFSPVVIMQRFIRGHLTRLRLKRSGLAMPRKPILVAHVPGKGDSLPPTPEVPLTVANVQDIAKSPVQQRVTFDLSSISEDRPVKQQQDRNLESSVSVCSAASIIPSAPPTLRRTSIPLSVSLGSSTDHPPAPCSSPQRRSLHINLYRLEQNIHNTKAKDITSLSQGVTTLTQAKVVKHKPQQVPKPITHSKPGTSELPDVTVTPNEITKSIIAAKKELKSAPPRVSPRAGRPRVGPTESKVDNEMGVKGKMMGMWFGNPYADMLLSKKEDGETVRAAMREYEEMLRQLPPKKIVRHNKLVTPEERVFNRIYTTMTLSALKAVERVYESRKKVVSMTDKVDTVKRIKQDLLDGKQRINDFHKARQEKIHDWKEEESKMQAKAAATKKAEKKIVVKKKQHRRALRLQNQSIRAADRKFFQQFSQQNNLVKHTLAQEDTRLYRDEVVHDNVECSRQQREEEQHMLHEVRRYMEYRGLKLRSEGAAEKAKLNTHVLQAANERLMDAKQRVAQLRARQEVADQTVIAKFNNISTLLEEELTLPPESNPTLDYLEALFGKLEESPEQDTHYRLRRLHSRLQDSQVHNSPYSESRTTTGCLSHDSSRSYSHLLNNSVVLQGDLGNRSALMHQMMPPQPTLHVVEPEEQENDAVVVNDTSRPVSPSSQPPSTNDISVTSFPLLV